MPRLKYIGLNLTAVAALGLTSCSKDKASAPERAPAPAQTQAPSEARSQAWADDVPSPRPPIKVAEEPPPFPEPYIVADDSLTLSDWRKMSRDISLTDHLRFENPNPPLTEIKASCPDGQRKIEKLWTIPNASQIPFAKLLPDEVLVRDLNKSPISCNFIVQMAAGEKSKKNGYDFMGSLKNDFGDLNFKTSGPEVDGHSFLKLDPASQDDLNAPSGATTARMVCRDVQFEAVPIRNRVNLGSLAKSPRVNDRPVRLGEAKAEDLCRIVFYGEPLREGLPAPIQELTPLLHVRFTDQAFLVQKTDSPQPDHPALWPGHEFTLATYEVENLENEPRTFRFNQALFKTRVRLNLKRDPSAVSTIEDPRWPWTRMYTPQAVGLVALDQPIEFTLKPRDKMKFLMRYKVAGNLNCEAVRARMEVVDDLFLHEVDERHNVIRSIKLEKPPEQVKALWNHEFDYSKIQEYPVNACTY